MRILSIDTTAMLGSVALTDGVRIIVSEQQGIPGTHSERLMTTIDHVLSLAGWSRADIAAIAVALGPGSFTGLRIGLAAAKGIALALSLPVFGVSSLESLALNAAGFDGAVVPLIDARRGEIYAAAYRVEIGKRPKRILKKCALPPDMLIRKLKAIRGRMILVGDGALEHGGLLQKSVGKRAEIAFGAQCLPQAANLAFLALSRLKKGRGDDIAALVPDYVRRSDAEIGFAG